MRFGCGQGTARYSAHNVRWRLIQADTKAFQFVLDDSLVAERLEHVEDDEQKVAGPRNGDDLPTSSSAVLCSFNDTGKIENLYWRSVNVDCARNPVRQGCNKPRLR